MSRSSEVHAQKLQIVERQFRCTIPDARAQVPNGYCEIFDTVLPFPVVQTNDEVDLADQSAIMSWETLPNGRSWTKGPVPEPVWEKTEHGEHEEVLAIQYAGCLIMDLLIACENGRRLPPFPA